MIDSGADSNFLSENFVSKHKIPRSAKSNPVQFVGIDGTPLNPEGIKEEARVLLTCQVSDSTYHTDPDCLFDIIHLSTFDVILGLPYLRLHQPQIEWKTPCIHFNSEFCKTHCWITSQFPPISRLSSCDLSRSIPISLSAHPAEPLLPGDLSRSIPISLSAHPAEPLLPGDLSRSIPISLSAHPAESSHPADHSRSTSAIPSPSFKEFPKSSDYLTSTKTPQAIQKEFSLSSSSVSDPVPTTNLLPPQFADYADIFSKEKARQLPPHRPWDCEIKFLPDTKPPFGPIYPLSPDEVNLAKEYLKENLDTTFIRASTSPAASPIFFVSKEEEDNTPGKVPQKRLVVNYKRLDKITEKFRYPMPLFVDLFDSLRGAKIFSKIDLRSAFNLIRIKEGDEWKTAFRTQFGLFEYLVMPYGLANAPAYFQRFINEIFKDMIGKFVVIYMDDFLIYSENAQIHDQHVLAVLQRLRENHLYSKLEKCKFCVPSVKFLGFQISSHGIKPSPEKIQSVLEWPIPMNKKDLQVYLGFSNFLRKFVENYSKTAIPLHQLCRKEVPYIWTDQCQSAFEVLKAAIVSAPVLIHPDPQEPFIVETDASDFALGCILNQKDHEGNLHPCAFYSRKLNSAERNYSIYDKELLAIKVAFEEWRHYLEGAPHQITILSDHKGLEFLADAKVLNQRQARWSEFFNRFDFVIKYRAGSKNCQADALSRRADYVPSEAELKRISEQTILNPSVVQLATISRVNSPENFINRVKSALTSDTFYQSHLRSEERDLFTLTDDILFYQNRLYLPEGPLRTEAISACHDSPLGGHYGKTKTTELVCRRFYWSGMYRRIQDFCSTCETCCRAKSSRHLPYGPLMSLQIPDRPWSSVSLDFLTDLPQSEGMTVILVVVDRFSKMSHFIPMPRIPDAEETAKAFIREIVRLHGLPSEVISDRGPQFVSHFWKRFLELLGIQQCLSSAYHPQSDGQTERAIQVLEQYLRCFVSYQQDDWVPLLPLAEFSFNNTVNASSQMTPFFVNSGVNPRFEYLVPTTELVPNVEDRLNQLHQTHEQLAVTLAKAVEDQARFANYHRQDSPPLEVDDLVYLNTRNISSSRPCRKLDFKKLGPFKIRRIINPVTYELDLPAWWRIHPVFHVSLLEKAKPSYLPNRVQSHPSPIMVEGQEEFLVQAILDSRISHGRLEYLIDWEGYPPSERCWTPSEDVHAPAHIRAFHTSYPSKPHPQDLLRRGISEGE